MMQLEPGQPCPLCQVRPDVPCAHRPADETWRMREAPDESDGRKNNGRDGRSSNGLNFGGRQYRDARTGKTMTIRGG